jgi:hypothetical protein
MQAPVPDDERPVAETGQPTEDTAVRPDDERPVTDPGRDDPMLVPDEERPVTPAPPDLADVEDPGVADDAGP